MIEGLIFESLNPKEPHWSFHNVWLSEQKFWSEPHPTPFDRWRNQDPERAVASYIQGPGLLPLSVTLACLNVCTPHNCWRYSHSGGCPVGVLVPHEPPNHSYFHVQNTSLQIHAHLSFQSLIPSFYICYHQKEPSTLSEIQKEPCYYGEAGHWREEGPRMPIILTWKVNETNIYWVSSTSRCHLTKALS